MERIVYQVWNERSEILCCQGGEYYFADADHALDWSDDYYDFDEAAEAAEIFGGTVEHHRVVDIASRPRLYNPLFAAE